MAWDEGTAAADNYSHLGGLLAADGDIFRQSDSGLMVVSFDGSTKLIGKAADLAPLIVDRIDLSIFLGDKPKGPMLSTTHQNAMLRSDAFMSRFPIVDIVTKVPLYLPDFSLALPGYNDAGDGHRYLYIGSPPAVADSLECTIAFLDVMDFDSAADRANALAAILTVMFWNHWPGGKPIILVTASKSHAGKDTIIVFASGLHGQCSISYQSTDWAQERNLIAAVNFNPDSRVLVIENARLDRASSISSAFIERFATDPNPFLFSTGTGPARRVQNYYVLAISTNYGTVSEDILNRSLPIHLNPVGHVAERVSPIGNPKMEYLPNNREAIAAELRGMISRWKDAGMPLDRSVKHSFSEWAATIGGILKVNGIEGFLTNHAKRRVADDPVRAAIGLLGVSMNNGQWYKPDDLTRETVRLGLVKQLIPKGDQESFESRKRGLGVVLSRHENEKFHVETDTEIVELRLERGRKRFDGENPHVRYRFVVETRAPIAGDE
jgi:hypothetical protein